MKRLFEIDLKDYKESGNVFRRPSARAIIRKGDKIALVYSKKEKYYLAVVNDASGVVESITEFKIDIAFSNIFDDGFGF